MATIKILNPTNYDLSLMKIVDVKKFLAENYVDDTQISKFIAACNKWISIEQTRPVDTLTDENVYIEIDAHYTVNYHFAGRLFRQMECEVIQYLSEKRWFHQVQYAA